jgi:hypothetical protein
MGLSGTKFDRNLTLNNSNVSLPCVREYALLLVHGRFVSHVKLITQLPWIQFTKIEYILLN